mmetsp:Transcript_19573/g.63567  ORF Transcript_19573/g.63567 Transcript_19573/m.63567 type:complete len:202 (-) Transcript_19573:73-678(-)
MAAMAWMSSSFSACAVPKRRHASAAFALPAPAPSARCTAASSASTASDSTPRSKSRRPSASGSGCSRNGFSVENWYGSVKPSASPPSPSGAWSISLNASAHSSPVPAPASRLGISAANSSAQRWLANSSAHPVLLAPPPVKALGPAAWNSSAHAAPVAAAALDEAPAAADPDPSGSSRTAFPSNKSSPLLIFETKRRNCDC